MALHTSMQPELLTSWKEIAQYLGKGVRTVQRWEIEFGMPVRRPKEKAKGVVHATRHDLNRWLEERWTERSQESRRRDLPLNGEHVIRVHASIKQSAELRQANRLLLQGIRDSLASMSAECQELARNVTRMPWTD